MKYFLNKQIFVICIIFLALGCTEKKTLIQSHDHKPIVIITSPLPNSSHLPDSIITFSSKVIDLDDEQTDNSTLVWTSNVDGQIGTGPIFQTNNLSENFHLIILTVMDSDSNVVADTIKVFVRSNSSTWIKTFGGSNRDRGYSVCEMFDGSYLITGSTQSFGAGRVGSPDLYLLKVSNDGELIWQKTFGGSGSEVGYQIKQTSDGGFIVVGHNMSDNSTRPQDVYLIKLDYNGDLVWEKTIDNGAAEYGYSVCEAYDGGFVITGSSGYYTKEDVLLVKTDDLGNVLWKKTFGGANNDRGTSIQETFDKGFIITGYTNSYGAGDDDVYVLKTDSLGTLLWEKTFGGAQIDQSSSIVETNDGGFVVTGFTASLEVGSHRLYLIKLDINGNLIWEKTYGGTGHSYGHEVKVLPDNCYVVVGRRIQFGYQVYLFKTDLDGNLIWEKNYGGGNTDYGIALDVTSEGGFILTGVTFYLIGENSDVCVIKTDSEGNVY